MFNILSIAVLTKYLLAGIGFKSTNVNFWLIFYEQRIMTFLEALYGSQYAEIKQNGKDGNKGRLNGNLFLTSFVLLVAVMIILFLSFIFPAFGSQLEHVLPDFLKLFTGRGQGQILAIVFGGILYFIIVKTVGSEYRFQKYVSQYLEYPLEVRRTANRRLLFPFFSVILIVFVLAVAV